MPEYNLDFSECLILAAENLAEHNIGQPESNRATLYFSLLSCEITLKALLDQTGHSIRNITRLAHDLENLMHSIDECETHVFPFDGAPERVWIPASGVHACTGIFD